MTDFLTFTEAKPRLAALAAEIEANGGTPPVNCTGFQTSAESRANIVKMEAMLEDCKRRKKAKGIKTATIECHAEAAGILPAKDIKARIAAVDAAVARLEATRATAQAAAAKERAKEAAAAVSKPASKTPHLDCFNALHGAEATAYFKAHSRTIRAEQSAAHLEAKTGKAATVSGGIVSASLKA